MTEKTNNGLPDNESPDGFLPIHDKHVAIPEVRTGKVDVEGDFHKEQHEASHHGVSFDTVAVPEYHTGKCTEYDPDAHEHDAHHKHHGLLSDLARIIANGTTDD